MNKEELKYILFGDTGKKKKRVSRKRNLKPNNYIRSLRLTVGHTLIRLSGREIETSNRPVDRRRASGSVNGVKKPVKINNSRNAYRKKRILKRRIQDVAIVLLTVFFAWSIFFVIRYKPFSTKEVAGKTLHGQISEKIDCVGINSQTLRSGKKYKVKTVCEYTDVFHIKAQEELPAEDVKISLNNNTKGLKDLVKIEGNTIALDKSILTGENISFTVEYKDKKNVFEYEVKNRLKDYLTDGNIITNPYSLDAVANKNRRLPGKFEPNDLVQPNVPFHQSGTHVKRMRKEAATALEQLFKGANAAGHKLYAVSGYRSYDLQVGIFQSNVIQYGSEEKANMYSSKPGTSDHQLGLVMDISNSENGFALTEGFGKTAGGKWVKKNCYKYGFIIRYPKGKSDITGYEYEPWHLRYVGKNLAKKIYDNNLALEECFE